MDSKSWMNLNLPIECFIWIKAMSCHVAKSSLVVLEIVHGIWEYFVNNRFKNMAATMKDFL